MRAFADRLLDWWDAHGRHDLPWQHPRTPYRVWVSEVMLQQTQVATVIPYFERWMQRFPGLPSLAEADLDEVLGLWSGLGYYARARHLHAAARECMDRHGGNLPADPKALAALPGIGESTANAIFSQAWDRPATVLDGNVKRVLARHAGVDGWPGHSKVHRKLWQQAEVRLPASRGADYTQAIMDLGATVCTARQPSCEVCPVTADCLAFKADRVDALPAPRPRREVPEVTLDLWLITDSAGRVLLRRRSSEGVWGGLWSLPEGEHEAERLALPKRTGIRLPDREHRLTHRALTLRTTRFDLGDDAGAIQCDEALQWSAPEDWRARGLPQPVRRLLETHLEEPA